MSAQSKLYENILKDGTSRCVFQLIPNPVNNDGEFSQV